MSDLDIDPRVYFDAGDRCDEAAIEIFKIFNRVSGRLSGCGSMVGSDDTAGAWAASYDARAATVSILGNDFVKALNNYGGALRTAGANHITADESASGRDDRQTERSREPGPTPGCSAPPPPSAGGPGQGLVDGALGLASRVGVAIPDADTDRLAVAADIWQQAATSREFTQVADALHTAIASFELVTSPEVDLIVDDLAELVSITHAVQTACQELANSCEEYRQSILEFRAHLLDILDDLAVELGVTAAITVAAAFVTFGLSAATGAVKSANTMAKFARIISETVAAWRISKGIERGVAVTDDLRGVHLVLERLKSLGRAVVDKTRPSPTHRHMSELFDSGAIPKASDLEKWARSEGWTRSQTENGPMKFVDGNGIIRMTVKRGSDRTPGSAEPHVELRDASGLRTDPFGNPVSRRSIDNHTPIEWDLP